jgi:hypothetical protein
VEGNPTNENQSLSSTLFLLLKQLSGLECKFYFLKVESLFVNADILIHMKSSHGHSNCVLVLMAAGSSSEQINNPNYLVNLLKNLAALASTQAYQDILKNANSNSTSNAGNNAANGSTMHEPTMGSIPVGSEPLAGKTFYCLLVTVLHVKYQIFIRK